MKKHNGIITLALAGILVISASAITGYHCSQADKVVVSERILFGDKKEVADVTITQYDSLNSKLIWEITTPLADVTQAKTTFTQSRERRPASMPDGGMLDVCYNLDMSGSSSGTFDFDEEYRHGFGQSYPDGMLKDVASRVPVGKTYTEEVRVADYGDYYTPEIHGDFPDSEVGDRYFFDSQDTEEDTGILSKYFRIPVKEDDIAIVTMTHNGNNGINEITLDLQREGFQDYNRPSSAFVGDSVYCATATEGGTQIHRIDFVPKNGVAGMMVTDAVGPVGEEIPERMMGFYDSLILREGKEQLFLLCGEDFLDKILVLSLDDMEIVQEIELDKFDMHRIYQQEDYFVLYSYGGEFIVFEEGEDGLYTAVLEGNYAANTDMGKIFSEVTAMHYREGKLVVAFRTYRSSESPTVYVTANTVQGCVFGGAYTSTLDEEVPVSSRVGNWVQQWDDKPLEIVRAG